MLEVGVRVKIEHTTELYRWGVKELAGKIGTIIDVDNTHHNNSYLVLMDDIYNNEREWFFPQEACVKLNQ